MKDDDHPTPLPWEVSVWDKNVFVHGGPNNDDIAEFNFKDEATVKITKDEAIANATLFAGAPALKQAAEVVLNYLEADGVAHKGARDVLRAAILQASVCS